MKKKLIALAVVDVLLVLAAVLFFSVNKSTLIIRFGIAVADVLVVAVPVFLTVAFVAANGVFLYFFIRWRRLSAAPPLPPLMNFAPGERVEIDEVRQELLKYPPLRPALRDYIQKAVAQLDSFTRKRQKIQHILERSGAESMDEVVSTVDATGQTLGRNMLKIINRIILWDPLEWNKPEKAAIYDGHRAYIQKVLDKNEEMLSMCDVLLAETVSYIDEKNTGMESSTLHLEVMTETIQSLRRIHGAEH